MSDFDTLALTHGEDGVSTLTLQRPDKLNALNPDVLDELKAASEEAGARDDLRVLILKGEGRAFIAGADIASMAEMSPEEAEAFGRKGHQTMAALESLSVPVIAAVDGFALGGGLEVALSCDLIYASGRATFGLPEVSLGIIPGFGGTQRLGRVVGWQRAREMVYSASRIDAETAEEIGLVCDCFEVDTFEAKVREVAASIASNGPLAVRAAKQTMHAGQETPLEEGLELERRAFAELFETDDRVEGLEAFIESRDPEFQGS